jgi:sec-independent protein translocase protein
MAERTYLIDSHCHLHDQEFFVPAAQLSGLKNAKLNQVDKIVCIGTDHQDSLNAQRFVQEHPESHLFWSYGIHPSEWQASRSAVDFKKQECPPIAIGEVGLDYHYGYLDQKQQIALFEEMIQLAIDQNLPLIFHIREAFDDFFAILGNFSTQNLRGVVHSFTDNKKNLNRSLEHGFYIGVNGLATYSTLPLPPLERILLETDAPFLSPVPYRGQTNEPSHIKEIATWLATKLQLALPVVVNQTSKNTEDLFGI